MKPFRIHDTEDHISAEAAQDGTTVIPFGTILILVRGMTLHNDVPICIAMRDMAFNQDVKALRPFHEVDSNFLAYALLAGKPFLRSCVDSASHGTGRIHTEVLRSLPLRLPSIAEQRAIAHVLGALDDKIELNRRMNQTLEQIARAIFKSWFVDFDPVRAKSEGRQPPGLDPQTAALFPDSFTDSPLGKIPKGWTTDSLGAVCEFAYGKALKEESRIPGSVPVFGSNGQVGWHDERLVAGPGIIVGRKGNPGIVTWCSHDFFPIDTTFYVLPRTVHSLYYLFFALGELDLPSLGADSAVPGLNRNMAYLSNTLVPQDKVLTAFEKLVTPLFRMIDSNNDQSKTLAAIRDALLPKLLSGEIRIRDAEKITGEVA